MLGTILGLECLGQLDAPFILQFGDSKESSSHDGDYDGCEEAKGTLPDVLGACPMVFTERIKSTNETGSNDDAYQQAKRSAKPDLEVVRIHWSCY